MTDPSATQPRGHHGHPTKFTFRNYSAPAITDLRAPEPAIVYGSFPVRIDDLPDAQVYQFQAAALKENADQSFTPYFSLLEFRRLTEVLNSFEEGSEEPVLIAEVKESFAISYDGGELSELPSINRPSGRMWALGTGGADTEFVLREGEWFGNITPETNATKINLPKQVGDTYDRAFSVCLDEDRIVNRTATWFIEVEEDADKRPTYTVHTHTQGQASGVPVTAAASVDPLHTLGDAQAYAYAAAARATQESVVDGWDGRIGTPETEAEYWKIESALGDEWDATFRPMTVIERLLGRRK